MIWSSIYHSINSKEKGFFTKEIEEALLNGDTGSAIHSHKDLPTESPEELMIAAVSDRRSIGAFIDTKESVDESKKKKFALKYEGWYFISP